VTTTANDLRTLVEAAFSDPRRLEQSESREAVEATIAALDRGEVRLAEPGPDDWVVHAWVQQAILLYFRVRQLETIQVGPFEYHDKLPLKHDYAGLGVRVVPPAVARFGSFLEPGVIMMPSYVNIGARVGSGTMVDTWATVGSGAQIGRDVHLAGGVGIGGVLEPPGARPVIIEDGAFIGSRCIVTEGVLVERGAVLGAQVCLTSSTPIIDVTGTEPVIHKGRVPARSVVVPGTRKRAFPAGEFEVGCALIIGERTDSTDQKTSLNNALRDFGVSA
jgi:2,3,4,5-tetrahydropyridine-2-carboxylate N-succinyltransferase